MRHAPPSWVEDAIFYQIFPDRFARSGKVKQLGRLEAWDAPPTRDGVKGGDLLGVIEHLDHLAELGVNALYLNPIFASAANHRYHTADFYSVDATLGGEAAFRTLLDACHARGMRVVIDGVFNHVGRGFFAFHDVLEKGPESRFLDWFEIEGFPLNAYGGGSPRYATWAGHASLPKLAVQNPEVREYLMGVAEHWARFGIDGWRLDTPEEIRVAGFWEELSARVKAVNPELYLVGEVWTDPSEWVGASARFDAVLGYWFGGRTLAFAAREHLDLEVCKTIDYPLKTPLDGVGYAEFIETLLGKLPEATRRAALNLDSSHDTPRLLTLVREDWASFVLCRMLLYCFVGAPCLYYGDEVGLTGGHDPGSRAAFPWQHPERWNQQALALHKSLGRLRREHVALRRGSYRRLSATASSLAFAREAPDQTLVVVANAGDSAEELALGTRVSAPLFVHGQVEVGADGVVRVGARSGAVLG